MSQPYQPTTGIWILTTLLKRFLHSESKAGIILILCTVVSLSLANSAIGESYTHFWHIKIAGMSLEHFINDALMAIFFLLVGLEIERQIYIGELRQIRAALLPIFAAIGGMCVPALIHYGLAGAFAVGMVGPGDLALGAQRCFCHLRLVWPGTDSAQVDMRNPCAVRSPKD